MTNKLTEHEQARVLRILREYFPNSFDDYGQAMENNVLAVKVAMAFADSDRIDYLEKQARLSYTGLSINGHPNGTTEIMWHHQRFDPQPDLRKAIELAREHFPQGQAKPAPPGTRAVIRADQMVVTEPVAEQVANWRPKDLPQKSGTISRRGKLRDWGDQITNKIFEMVVEQSSVSVDEANALTLDTDLEEWGHMDSLDQIEMIMRLEDEFACEISDEDGYKFRTIEHMVQYVKRLPTDY